MYPFSNRNRQKSMKIEEKKEDIEFKHCELTKLASQLHVPYLTSTNILHIINGTIQSYVFDEQLNILQLRQTVPVIGWNTLHLRLKMNMTAYQMLEINNSLPYIPEAMQIVDNEFCALRIYKKFVETHGF